jgi:two-component system sensor histidine kinase YesM
MNIQGMRLSETIRYESQVDAGLEDAPIPPLLLITFIENTIKHATPPSGVLQVFVSCTSTLKEEEKALFDQGIRIEIPDNGQGFPEDVLQHLQGGIGIANCIQRLHLLYGEHYRIHLDNAPEGGARITLLLPTQR